MSRRGTSLHDTTGTAIAREIGSKYDNVKTVADSIDNVDAVGHDLQSLDLDGATPKPDGSSVDIVATNIADVNTVATPLNLADVKTTAANIADVGVVSTNVADVTVVADNIDGTVSLDVGIVADNIVDINTVSDNIDGTVSTDVPTVVANLTNIDIVANNIDNVNVTGTNISDVNNFALVYQVSAVEPTQRVDLTPLQAGDLWFDTVVNSLKKYDGAQYVDTTVDALAEAVIVFTNKTITDISNHVHANTVHFKVKATEAIGQAQAVKVTGWNVGEAAFEVALADQTTDIATGVSNEALTTGEFGTMVTLGELSDVDTSAFSEGAILYVNGGGTLTATEPTVGFSQPIAYVARSHANNGVLQVSAQYPKQDADDVRYEGAVSVKTKMDETRAIVDATQRSGNVLNTATTENPVTQATAPETGSIPILYTGNGTTQDVVTPMQVKNSHRISDASTFGDATETHAVLGSGAVASYSFETDIGGNPVNLDTSLSDATFINASYTVTNNQFGGRGALLSGTGYINQTTHTVKSLSLHIDPQIGAAGYIFDARVTSGTGYLLMEISGALTYAGGNLYVDGVYYASGAYTLTSVWHHIYFEFTNPETHIYYGASSVPSVYYVGYMDQLRLFDKNLDATEIRQLAGEYLYIDSEEWNSITTYLLNEQCIDHSATGDSRTYENITGTNTTTSPRLDATNWRLATEQYGGRFWFKNRDVVVSNAIYDSIRGVLKEIQSDLTAIEFTRTLGMTDIKPLALTVSSYSAVNGNTNDMVLWVDQTTRKTAGYRTEAGVIQNSKNNTGTDLLETTSSGKPVIIHYNPQTKFEITMYEGDGVAGHDIPATFKADFRVTKRLTTAVGGHVTYNSYDGATKYQYLDTTIISSINSGLWNDTEPTEDKFILGDNAQVNLSANQYISYGQANSENHYIGAYQGTGEIGNEVDLGLDMTVAGSYVMIKILSGTGSWVILDTKRDPLSPNNNALYSDASNAEAIDSIYVVDFTETGIIIPTTTTYLNSANNTYLIQAYSPSYSKPTGGKEIGFNSNIGLVLANGKNANNALQTLETTVSPANLDVSASNPSTTQYVMIDDAGVTTVSEQPINSGQNRKDADKWGEYTDSRELTKTTLIHRSKESETGVVSSSTSHATYSDFKAFNGFDIAGENQWVTLSGNIIGYLQYDLTEKRVLTSYNFTNSYYSSTLSLNLGTIPINWTMEGLDDDGTWVVLDTVVGHTPVGNGDIGYWQGEFAIANTTAYNAYRLDITLNNGNGSYVGVGELKLDFAISDAPYLNTLDNVVYDSSDVAITKALVGEFKLDGQGLPFDIVNYPSNRVDMNSLVVHEEARFYGEMYGNQVVSAWVNFDGTTTPPTIRDSYNVKDVIRRATGIFLVVFKDPMVNNFYSAQVSIGTFTTDSAVETNSTTGIRTTNYVTVSSHNNSNNNLRNDANINVSVTGGK